MEEKEEKHLTGFMELLEGNFESGGSQETQMSSQGFSALLGDEELFAGIKAEEIDEFLAPQQQNASFEPVSPVSTASIESMGMDNVDEGLKNAFEASSRKGTLTPLLKEELRCKIQKRRLDAGLEELQALQPQVPVAGPSHMSEESLRRQEVRKMRNREAAKRCRLKKHQQERQLRENARRAEEENKQLKANIERNKLSIMHLQTALHSHFCVNRPPRLSSPNL